MLHTVVRISIIGRLKMKSTAGFDVRRHAGKIFFRVSTKTMPPDKLWSDNRIAKFKQWIDGGMKQ